MVYRDAMNNFDFYAATRRLILLLMSAGFAEDAHALKAAIEEGSTGTEILMGIRFHVVDIGRRLPLDEEARSLAESIVSKIEEALGS